MTPSAWETVARPGDGAQPMASGCPALLVLAPAGRLLAGLVLLCLVPRVLMAWKLDAVCRDGVFYIQLAEAFERGDVEAGLNKLRLNTYPPVLALLHHAGLDWEWAGKYWGVCISSLAVLPLFGWARRQFDDRLATVACILYAVHPKLIEWGPELVRDPTFWFFWVLSLYCCWRAAAETRWTWYLAGGVTIALALHTRFEGWCLYVPLVWWSACRYWARRELRRVVVSNLALSFAVCPLLIALVNVTWLAHEPHWEWGNFGRLEYVALWFRAAVGKDEPPSLAAAIPSAPLAAPPTADDRGALASVAEFVRIPNVAVPIETLTSSATNHVAASPPRLSNGRLLWMFANALRRGVGALFGVLWLVGFATSPRTWLRRDQVVLFLVAAMIVGGIWVHLWYAQATSSRYFLALVLIGSPCAATGWLRLCGAWASWSRVAEFVRIPKVAVPNGTLTSSATRDQSVAEFVRIPKVAVPNETLTSSATRDQSVAEFVRIPKVAVPNGTLTSSATRDQSVAEFVRNPSVALPIGTLASTATRDGRRFRLAYVGMFVLLTVCGVGEALADKLDARRREAALGRWVFSEFGPGRRLATSSDSDVLAYYARGTAISMPGGNEAGPRWLADLRPDLAILTDRGTSPARLREIVAEVAAGGYRPLEPARLPADYDWTDTVVLQR